MVRLVAMEVLWGGQNESANGDGLFGEVKMLVAMEVVSLGRSK